MTEIEVVMTGVVETIDVDVTTGVVVETIDVDVTTDVVVETIGVVVETIDEVAMTGVAETIDVVAMTGVVVETIGVDVTTDVIIVDLSKIHILETIGLVVNVETQTSHLEQNVTDVVPQKGEVRLPHETGKAMTEGPVTEEKSHNQELVIGNVLNVENLTLQNETNASDVVAQRELVDRSRGGIIAN